MDLRIVILALSALVLGLLCGRSESAKAAYCQINPDTGMPGQNIQGNITIIQESEDAESVITVKLTGFDATDSETIHGFHVHNGSSVGSACADMLGHFDDGVNTVHGSPDSDVRHIGDLGNVEETANANDASIADVSTVIRDRQVSLYGSFSVVGKGFVVHETFDDLGLGNETDSLTTGHAGGRLGCCVIIGIDDYSSGSTVTAGTATILLTAVMCILKL